MKARDMIEFFEWAKTFQKPTKMSRPKKEKEKSVFEQLQEMQQTLTLYQQWLKDQEKLNKKEEKKEEKKDGMSVIHVAMLTILLSACSGPFYFWMFGRMAGKW